MASPVLQVRVSEETLARIDAARGEATRSDWARDTIVRALDGQLMTPEQAVAYVYAMRTASPVPFDMAPQLIEEAAASTAKARARRTAPKAATEAESSPPVADGFPAPRLPRWRGGE